MLRKINLATLSGVLIAVLASSSASLTLANPIIPIPGKQAPIISPSAPTLDAKAYILMDAASGKVLVEKNSNARMAPASLTKLMTLYIIAGALKNGSIHLNDKVHISEKAWRTGGSKMFVKVGDEVPVSDLVQGIAVASGNDAAVAMAEYLAGSEDAFASVMNQQAKALGMTESHFVDCNGLPNADHYSSARDLALLAQAFARDYPETYKLFSEKWFTYNNIRQPNRNRLLWRFQYADGLKTGHTDDAGYCLVSSALKDNMRLISVIMGANSDAERTDDSVRLLTYGYRFFETQKWYDANTPVVQARVWKGRQKEVALGLAQDFYATLPTGQAKNAHPEFKLDDPITAPVVKGQAYGTLNIMLNNQVLESRPLVALKDDAKGNIFRRISDAMGYRMHKVFSHNSSEKANNG